MTENNRFGILALAFALVVLICLSGCCKLTENGENETETSNNSQMAVYQSGEVFSIIMNQTGESIMNLADRNTDGKIDYISMDTNGDGTLDAFLFDRDYDGKVDKWHVTMNEVDSYAWDMDNDGVPDVYDSDGDGIVDAWDMNGDGLIDQRDPDNDGEVELHDEDLDGVFDEIETLAGG